MEIQAIKVFEKHAGSVFCGSLNKTSDYVVTGGEDDIAYVWDVNSGEIVFECEGHEDSVIFADFSYDDSYVCTGDMSGIIKVWKTSDKTLAWSFNMEDATWMQWHAKANALFAGSVEGETYMWKIPEGDCKVLQGNGNKVETAVIFPDGKKIAIGYENGDINIIDLSTTKILNHISSPNFHKSAITSIDCHLNNNVIVSAGQDGKTIINPITSSQTEFILLQQLETENKNEEEFREVANEEELSDVIDEMEQDLVESKGNWVEAVAFYKDPKSQIVATGTLNGEIFIWDFVNKVLRNKIEQNVGVTKLLWLENSWCLFSGGLDGVIKCYDARIGHILRSFVGHSDNILDLYITKDEKKLLSTSDDMTARLFEINV